MGPFADGVDEFCWSNVQAFLAALSDEEQILLLKSEQWTYGHLVDRQGNRCLMGHLPARITYQTQSVATFFDSLCLSYGLSLVVSEIKQFLRALK